MFTIAQWEQRLKPYFNQSLRLLAEIPVTHADIEDICHQIRQCIKDKGLSETTEYLTQKFPLTFITALAGFSTFNHQQGYWNALGEELDVNYYDFHAYDWPDAFESIIKRCGLRCISHQETAQHYVASIRLHGGIPVYSLPDFFSRLLLPTVKRPSLCSLPTREAMSAVLQNAYLVDSSVINFFDKSGELGFRFFDSCRKLACHYIQSKGGLLSSDELEIPQYVIEAFEKFMDRTETEELTTKLRKPWLRVNPYEDLDRIWLMLPEQDMEFRYADGQFRWEVGGVNPAETIKITCVLKRRSKHLLVEEDIYPIEACVEKLHLSFIYRNDEKDVVLRRWTLELLPPKPNTPLMAFLPDDGRQIQTRPSLISGILFLIYPWDAVLQVNDNGRLFETYGRMSGAWSQFQMNAWDLTEAWGVDLYCGDEILGQCVPAACRQPEPELYGTASPFGSLENPLYIGTPPSIKFTLSDHPKLAQWQIVIESAGKTNPVIHFKNDLESLVNQKIFHEDTAELPLEAILGSEAVGEYKIQINGPGQYQKIFKIRLWPRLTPIDLPKYLLQPEQNNQAVDFLLHIPSEATCEKQYFTDEAAVVQKAGGWNITVGPDVCEVNLNLIWHSNSSDQICVPVCIPIPRLRWSLASEGGQDHLEWTSRAIQKSSANLLQNPNSSIYIEAHGLGRIGSRLTLALVDLENPDDILQEAVLKRTTFSPDQFFIPLGQFSGTLKNACQQGRFDLVMKSARNDPTVHIPLLDSPRSLDIQSVGLLPETATTWELCWAENFPLKNRRFMLVPAWQPWQEPWEYKIPDSARGSFLLEDVSLPETRYHVYFYIMPDWEQARTQPPSNLTPFIVDLIDPDQRLEVLNRHESQLDEEKLRIMIEKMCIYQDTGHVKEQIYALSCCLVPFTHSMNLRLMLGLMDWLDAHEIRENSEARTYQKNLRTWLYFPEKVENFLKKRSLSDPLLIHYLEYASKVQSISSQSALLILERTEDPIVIKSCLARLVDCQSDAAVSWILKLLDEQHISISDAAYILSPKIHWAVDELIKMDDSTHANALLANLFPKLGQESGLPGEKNISLMARVLPHEKEISIKLIYVKILIENGHKAGFEGLIQTILQGSASKAEIEDLISLAPQKILDVFESSSQVPGIQHWIEWIMQKFPKEAGIVKVNDKIRTPVGIGVIDKIEVAEKPVNQVQFRKQNACLNILVGNGAERFRALVDLQKKTIKIMDVITVWKCTQCAFIHPCQRVVARHSNNHPLTQKIQFISSTIPFELEEIYPD